MELGRRSLLKQIGALTGAATWRGEPSVGPTSSHPSPAPEAPGPPLKKIATEEAFTLPELTAPMREVLRRGGSNLDLTLLRTIYAEQGDGPVPVPVGAPSGANRDALARMLLPQLLEIGAARIADMDASGVDMHVLSLFMPGVQLFSRNTATVLARIANDRLSEAIRRHMARLPKERRRPTARLSAEPSLQRKRVFHIGAWYDVRHSGSGRQRSQFSTFSAGTRLNSATLSVTHTASSARACAAISMSWAPTGVPFFSNATRIAA